MESANTCGNFPFLGNKLMVAVNLDDIPCSPPTSDLGSFLHSDAPKSSSDPYKGVYENRYGVTVGASGYIKFSHKFTRERSSPSLHIPPRGLHLPGTMVGPVPKPLSQDGRSLSLAELIVSVSQSLPGSPHASPAVTPSSTPNLNRKTLSVSRLNSPTYEGDKIAKAIGRTRGISETCLRLSTNELAPLLSGHAPSSPCLSDHSPTSPTLSDDSPLSPGPQTKKQSFKPKPKITNRDMNFLAPQSM